MAARQYRCIRPAQVGSLEDFAEALWSYRTDYVRERHGIEVEWANEAPEDPDTLRIESDRDAR
jgi:hypothetical protein